MNMEKRPITAWLLCMLLTFGAAAQPGFKRADLRIYDDAMILFEEGAWKEAYQGFKRVIKVDTTYADLHYALGVCALNLPGHRSEAAAHFEAAIRHGNTESLYELAMIRHQEARFDEAINLLDTYRRTPRPRIDREEVDRRIGMAHNARRAMEHPVRMRIRNLGPQVNSPAHDYCPVITADGKTMYFTSRRAGSMGGLTDENGQHYEDIYMSQRGEQGWSAAFNLQGPVNSRMQDATVGLSPDGNEMIIYRADEKNPNGELLITQREQGQWAAPQRMTEKINSKYHDPSATISPDGTEIYFSSNRPGGFGGRDLYRIRRLPNGEWSEPLNLGPEINTQYDEDAPFIHSDGTTLFFSSNGHNTMGGYDIFKATLLNPDMNVWGKPENMGYPLNTVNDDIYFALSADGRTGYFSSERDGGLGGQDIHEVVFPVNQVEYALVLGVVSDGNEDPVGARIVVTDPLTSDVVGIYLPNPRTGRYVMALRPGRQYTVEATAAGFEPWAHDLYTGDEDTTDRLTLDIPMTRSEKTVNTIPAH